MTLMKKIHLSLLGSSILFSAAAYSFGIQIDFQQQYPYTMDKKNGYNYVSPMTSFWNKAKSKGLSLVNVSKLGNPIHESITKNAIIQAGMEETKINPYRTLKGVDINQDGKDDVDWRTSHTEILRGLLWNDDPEGRLFPQSFSNPKGYLNTQNGTNWLVDFGKFEVDIKRNTMGKLAAKIEDLELRESHGENVGDDLKEARAKLAKITDHIMYASHFGDLQYLHGMGAGTQTRKQVKASMMGYASHAWKTASGELTYKQQKRRILDEKAGIYKDGKKVPTTGGEVFRSRFDTTDLLYHTRNQKELQYRALGSFLHMVQDSYAQGHVVREDWTFDGHGKQGSNEGDIRFFQNYSEQDGHKHGVFDTPEDDKTGKQKSWKSIPGALKAATQSKIFIKYFMNECTWEATAGQHPDCPEAGVKGFLGNEVFKLVPKGKIQVTDEKGHHHPESTATRSHTEIKK